MVRWTATLALILIPLFLASALSAAEKESNSPVKLLSGNKTVTIQDGKKTLEAYEVKALAPLLFEVKGPGKLNLTFYKNYDPKDSKAAKKSSDFNILKNDELLHTESLAAVYKKGLVYKGAQTPLPGKPATWSVALKEGTSSFGIMLSIDARQGGAVSIRVEKEEEPELVPLVALVPLAPPAEKSAPAAKPEPAKQDPVPAEKTDDRKKENATPFSAAALGDKGEDKKEEKPVAAALPVPVDETQPKEAEKPEEQPEPEIVAASAEKDKKKGPHYVMIEPRFGANLAIQPISVQGQSGDNTQVDAMFVGGLSVRYVMPWLDERFRLGIGFDWQQYSYSQHVPNTNINIELMSVPILVEFDAFILTQGLFKPFVGLGVGPNYTELTWDPKDSTQLQGDLNGWDSATTKTWTYAIAVWAGNQFSLNDYLPIDGGPFFKVRYMISKADHKAEGRDPNSGQKISTTLLTNAEQGGLSFLFGWHFEI